MVLPTGGLLRYLCGVVQLLISLVACGSTAAPAPPPEPRLDRLVAVGDLHADLPATLAVLRMAGLVDGSGSWSGGTATLVQTGDVTDRGPDSKEVIELLARLETEATAAGGRVVALLGNHEVMNMRGDWRYVSEGDLADFGDEAARREAFSETGALGKWLRRHDIVAVVDRAVFCHGGVTPEYARRGLATLNRLVAGVLAGTLPEGELAERSPIWYRGYVQDPEPEACPRLDQALEALGADRMVVGHTTRDDGRIQARCGGRLAVIDTGISAHYGNHLSALEIMRGDARALYPSGPVDLLDP